MAAAVSIPDLGHATTAPRPPSPKELANAERDLEWWFAQREGDLQLSGAGYEPVPSHVHDQEAQARTHERRSAWAVTVARRKHDRIAPFVAPRWDWDRRDVVPGLLGLEHIQSATAIYTPRVYPDHLRILFAVERPHIECGMITLVGVALLSEVLHDAFARAHGGKAHRSLAELLDWMDVTVRKATEKSTKVPPLWCRQALTAARGARERVLEAYVMVTRGEP
jgi:hypothetical protein